jgi:hypothetical protein
MKTKLNLEKGLCGALRLDACHTTKINLNINDKLRQKSLGYAIKEV